MTDHTHDPALRSWVESANQPDCGFPIQNLPFGAFRRRGETRVSAGIAIGHQVLDAGAAFGVDSVRSVMELPRDRRTELRHRISAFLQEGSPAAPEFLTSIADVEMLLPCEIGDYTDFYASIHHAANVGGMFRPENPLLPNYKWLPVGYHGRASSIVVSGTPIRRPRGQTSDNPAGPPSFGPTRRLDYELELGAFLGPGNPLGTPIPPAGAPNHIVGVCLLNDWSARDLQTWEYQPLGPFLAKNFATSISPWIVTAEALDPFRCNPDPRSVDDPRPLPHLQCGPGCAYSITLEVWFRTAAMRGQSLAPVRLSRSHFASLYWTLSQMVAHHTSNGCNIRPGDLIGSGTVSGPEKENRGCLLELTWRGAEPIELPSGEQRRFLEDGDEVTLRGYCQAPGFRSISLGECAGEIIG